MKLTSDELRQKWIEFFKDRGHTPISSASLIPENDPTVLFTTAGMHPLVPYLLGQPHPAGKRLCDTQKCVRTGDIDEVGDASHCTFFEMLGNWSLGDYFKKEMVPWSYEFLTEQLGIAPDRLAVTVRTSRLRADSISIVSSISFSVIIITSVCLLWWIVESYTRTIAKHYKLFDANPFFYCRVFALADVCTFHPHNCETL